MFPLQRNYVNYVLRGYKSSQAAAKSSQAVVKSSQAVAKSSQSVVKRVLKPSLRDTHATMAQRRQLRRKCLLDCLTTV